jgi:putative ABC transport system substrate-binding protein
MGIGLTLLRRAIAGVLALVIALLGVVPAVEAQQAKLYRVGVIYQGGTYFPAIAGLRDGLKELGLQEGKQYVLHVRDTKGDLKSVEVAARNLEAEKVDLIYAVATSVALAAKRATKSVPIVFYAGTDPVALGLVDSYRKPGGRLTGVHGRFTELSAKRLELLKAMIPGLRKVVTFYNPDNTAAQRSIQTGRDAARQLQVEIAEQPVASIAELQARLEALRPGDADAFFYVADAMVNSQAERIIAIANAKKLATMFSNTENVAAGALASYGASFYAIGRLSARYVQRILAGADPGGLPVEQVDRVEFAINLKTAKALGLRIPDAVLARADQVIE